MTPVDENAASTLEITETVVAKRAQRYLDSQYGSAEADAALADLIEAVDALEALEG